MKASILRQKISCLLAAGLCGIGATARADYSTSLLGLNPIVYYHLEETGTAVATNIGSLGSAANAAYHSNSVPGVPGVPFAGFGVNNRSVQFNGVSGNVAIPPLSISTDQFTFSCWFKQSAPNHGHVPFIWQRNADNTANSFGVEYWDADRLFTMWNDQDWGNLPVPAVTPISGVWNFLTVVWTPDDITMYLNGTPSSTAASHLPRDFSASSTIYLGYDSYWKSCMNGLMDEVALFNRALSPVEIQSLYDAGQATPQIVNLTRTPTDPIFASEVAPVNMTVTAFGPGTLGYQWRKNGTPLTGQNSTALTFAGASAATGDYDVVVTNSFGSVTSSIIAIAVTPGGPPAYWATILGLNPAVYYPLEETGTIAGNRGSLGSVANGLYTAGSLAGAPGVPFGPFGTNNRSVQFNGVAGSIALPPLSINTDQFTFSCWFKQTAPNTGHMPFIWQRNPDNTYNSFGVEYWDAANLFTMWNDQDWGNLPAPVVAPLVGVWNFLTVVWTPEAVTMYLNGTPSTAAASHLARDFSAASTLYLGYDSYWQTHMNGLMDEVALFNRALSPAEIQSLYDTSRPPPQIVSLTRTPADPVFEGATVNMAVSVSGPAPMGYQWRKNGTPLTGQTSTALAFNNASADVSGNYDVVVTNSFGSVTSSIVVLSVTPGAPVIFQQPPSISRFAGGLAVFSPVVGGSTPMTNQWYFNGNPIPGATGATYTIPSVTAADVGSYTLKLSNAEGSNTTAAAVLTLLAVPTPYASAIMSARPAAYWSFNETSGTIARDFAGGHDGTIHGGLTLGSAGPAEADFPGLGSPNTAFLFNGANAYVQALPLNINTNELTIVALLKRTGSQSVAAALFNSRFGPLTDPAPGQDVFQFGIAGDGASLQYVWANEPTWDFNPGFSPADGQWSFVALSVGADKTVMYLDDGLGAGLVSAEYAFVPEILPMQGPLFIGADPAFGGRAWNGGMDEAAIYKRALTSAEVGAIHDALQIVILRVTKSGSDLQLAWPKGTLEWADQPTGSWTDVPGATPPSHTLAPAGTKKFFRVRY